MKTAKRILSLVLCVALLTGLIPTTVRAAGEKLHSSGLFYYSESSGEITITRGAYDESCPEEGWPITVTIPDQIDGYPVTEIADDAFWSWYALDTIYLPETLEEIGDQAFESCEQLRVVDIPHVTSIGDYAFEDCMSLEAIILPSSVESIGKYAFWGCESVGEISIGEVTGKQPDHQLDWDYTTVFYEMGSPVTVKLGNIVTEFDTGYIYRDRLQELWVAKRVNLIDSAGMGIDSDTVVYGYTGSSAESYAAKQGVTFIPLDDDGTADEPVSMSLVSVSPDRGSETPSVSDLELTFNMTPARNVYGGSIYIKNYETDRTVLELDWEDINRVSLYDGNTVRLPNVLSDLEPGKYYVLIDNSLFTADQVVDGVLYAFPGITQKEYWTFTTNVGQVLDLYDETFQYKSTITSSYETYTFRYTDEWFSESSYKYNQDLAQMSIRTAMAAAMTDSFSIENLFDKLELYYDNTSIHYPAPTPDTIGYAIGSKTVKDENGQPTNLVVVAVRGGGYGEEWASNLTVGTASEHQGFSKAADTVVDAVQEYISRMPWDTNIRVWITGYSRAAAVSNLAAHELNQLASSGKITGLTQEGIYAYCFECPRGVRSDDPGFSNLDRNIFNIVNPIDLVPMVAFPQWKFDRYGITLYLPYREGNNQQYREASKRMTDQYNRILRAAGVEEDASEYTQAAFTQNALLTELTEELTTWLRGQYYYASWYQDRACSAIVSSDTSNDTLDIIHILELAVPEFVLLHGSLCARVAANAGNITKAHYPELCLAWMDAVEAEDLSTDARTRYVKINCPVNAFVYDSNGDFVASIVDNEVYGSAYVGAYIDTNGQKILILPADGEFYVEIHATGNGMVSCQIEEYDMDSMSPTRLVNYYDIPVSTDDTLDLYVGTQDTVSTDYTLTDTDGEVVTPDADVSNSQITEYILTVTAEGDGSATGGGSFLEGEFAIVTAVPGGNARFLGWYADGILVSSEAEYRFRVEQDLTLTARFVTEAAPDIPDVPISNPFTDVKASDYFYEPVLWAVQNGITSGMTPTTFMPNNSCTRGQVVTFLWRAAGEPMPTSTRNPFTDVKASDYFYNAVLWAVEQGITTGMSATSFSPSSPCTRGQVVTFLWRAAGEPTHTSSRNPFTDVKSCDYFYTAVLWAVEDGITTGMSATSFGPSRTCTRGQVVTFLYRAESE